MKRWILFDLDLTLLNTREIHLRGIASAFQGCLGVSPTLSAVDRLMGQPLDAQFAEVFSQTTAAGAFLSPALTDQLRKAYARFYRDNMAALITIYPEILDVLSALRESHHHLGLVSSKRRGIGERELSITGLASFFPITVFLNDVTNPKPSPEVVFRAMQLADLNPDEEGAREKVVVVGDAVEDILCARNAGVLSVHAIWKWMGQIPAHPLAQGATADWTAQRPLDLLHFLREEAF